ncbi:hypothetical protein, partial [Celeribacter neptunius]|uniref:hypothetical protein n=1 Tax=Celeribacter neptunius TaxID=588602 RepID=UPI0015A5DDEF
QTRKRFFQKTYQTTKVFSKTPYFMGIHDKTFCANTDKNSKIAGKERESPRQNPTRNRDSAPQDRQIAKKNPREDQKYPKKTAQQPEKPQPDKAKTTRSDMQGLAHLGGDPPEIAKGGVSPALCHLSHQPHRFGLITLALSQESAGGQA